MLSFKSRTVFTVCIVIAAYTGILQGANAVDTNNSGSNLMAFVGNCIRPITRTLQRLPFLNRLQSSFAASKESTASCFNHDPRRSIVRGSGMMLRSASTVAETAAVNPLLLPSDFPRFDAVKAEHVGPGIRTLIKDSESHLIELENDLKRLGETVQAKELLVRLEQISDALSRAWSTCSHLKAGLNSH